jgi:hypothetical protein
MRNLITPLYHHHPYSASATAYVGMTEAHLWYSIPHGPEGRCPGTLP